MPRVFRSASVTGGDMRKLIAAAIIDGCALITGARGRVYDFRACQKEDVTGDYVSRAWVERNSRQAFDMKVGECKYVVKSRRVGRRWHDEPLEIQEPFKLTRIQ